MRNAEFCCCKSSKKTKKNNDFKLNSKKTMKTKAILMISALFLLTCCKKKDCITSFYSEGKPPVPNNTYVHNVDDLYKLYSVEFYEEDCDYSGVSEILSHNGDTVKVIGRFVDDWTSTYRWRLYDTTSNNVISIGVSDYYNTNFTPNDTSVYSVTGVLNINTIPALGYAKTTKSNSTNEPDLKCTHLSLCLIEAKERKGMI